MWFIDGDDVVSANAVDHLEVYLKDKNLEILQFNFEIESPDGFSKGIAEGLAENQTYNGINFLKLQQRPGNKYSNTAWHYLFNRNFLNRNKLEFPVEYSIQEDTYFTMMCLLKAKKVGYFNEPLYEYRLNQDSVTRKKERKVSNIVNSWRIYNDIEQRVFQMDMDVDFLKDGFNKRYIAMLTENFYLGNPLNLKRTDIIKFFKHRNLDFKDNIKKMFYLLPSFLRKKLCTYVYSKFM